jgi:hypothetical protein
MYSYFECRKKVDQVRNIEGDICVYIYIYIHISVFVHEKYIDMALEVSMNNACT